MNHVSLVYSRGYTLHMQGNVLIICHFYMDNVKSFGVDPDCAMMIMLSQTRYPQGSIVFPFLVTFTEFLAPLLSVHPSPSSPAKSPATWPYQPQCSATLLPEITAHPLFAPH